MARPDKIDSDIEQQLVENQDLFERMSAGAVEDDPEPEPVEEPETEDEGTDEEYDDDSDDGVDESDDEDDEDVPTEEASDDEDDDEAEEVKPPKTDKQLKKVKLYTPQELKELLADGDFSRVDTSRLSEEGKLVMKSMQSGLTPKLQEAAELRKELQALKESVEKVLPKPKPKDIYEAYDQDPTGTDNFINAKIEEAIQAQDPVELERMKEYRERLRIYKQEKAMQAKQNAPPSDLEIQKVAAKLVQAVPNIAEIQTNLRDYALQVMGYEADELAELTDLKRGTAAIREIQRIKNAWDKHTAARRAQAKAKKKRPAPVEKPGGGFKQNETTLKDLKQRAIKTGSKKDWLQVFEAMED